MAAVLRVALLPLLLSIGVAPQYDFSELGVDGGFGDAAAHGHSRMRARSRTIQALRCR
jgi:hypothetical protein